MEMEISKKDLEMLEQHQSVIVLLRAFATWKKLPNIQFKPEAIHEFMEIVKAILSMRS